MNRLLRRLCWYRIVQRRDGRYALRRGYLWHTYLDVRVGANIWWRLSDLYSRDCWGTATEVFAAIEPREPSAPSPPRVVRGEDAEAIAALESK